MSTTFLQEGLAAYARGNFVGAARAWLRGLNASPDDKALAQYLTHLRGQAAHAVETAEAEFRSASIADSGASPPMSSAEPPSVAVSRRFEAGVAATQRTPIFDAPAPPPPPEEAFVLTSKAQVAVEEQLAFADASASSEALAPPPIIDVPSSTEDPLPPVASDDVLGESTSAAAVAAGLSPHFAHFADMELGKTIDLDFGKTLDMRPLDDDPVTKVAVAEEPNDDQPLAEEPLASSGPDPWGTQALLGPTAAITAIADGFALVAAVPRPKALTSVASLSAKMREAAGLDDFSGALKAADELLTIEPMNADARRIRERARSVLTQMLISELGTLDAIPFVVVAADQVIWLDLDQRAGFVLSQIDGRSSFNDIVAVTGMDELETLGILARLVRDKIVDTR